MRTLSPLGASLHPVRLACLIHAASVHSEPGSNSPLKKSSTCDSGSTFTVSWGTPEPLGRPAHSIALSGFQRASFSHRSRRGAYFKPSSGDCKPVQRFFSSFFRFLCLFRAVPRGFPPVPRRKTTHGRFDSRLQRKNLVSSKTFSFSQKKTQEILNTLYTMYERPCVFHHIF